MPACLLACLPICAGINKADVRFVFHYSLPKSLEGYLQVGVEGCQGVEWTLPELWASQTHPMRGLVLNSPGHER